MRTWTRALLTIALCMLLLAPTLSGCQAGPGETLTVLAGSEIKDLEPLFDQIRRETGIRLEMEYIGTLDGAERLMAGEQVDLAWFSHAKYLSLLQGAAGVIHAEEKTMLSPVVLGVRENKAREWGWIDNPAITWRDIVAKAEAGDLRFAMTNPSSSNSGFTALMGVAAALSGSADALESEDIDRISDDLTNFFKGQTLTAGSSGWLAEDFVLQQENLDGIVNYESVLLGLNESGDLREPLYLIYPKEGIITADYPLMLVNNTHREAYDRLVEYLLSAEFQSDMMKQTLRRPINPQVALDSTFPDRLLVELPFPNSQEVIDKLIFAYLDEQRVPSHAFFVLDVSGSMRGEGLSDLQQAMYNLTGIDTSLSGQFARFRDRERVTIITFSETVQDVQEFDIELDDVRTFQNVRDYIDTLHAAGGTALYSALQEAYELAIEAKQADPNRYYSIVLMSDGKKTEGISERRFMSEYEKDAAAQTIKTFTILFADADPDAMESIAETTGGRMFDARAESLSFAFKTIRGYQ